MELPGSLVLLMKGNKRPIKIREVFPMKKMLSILLVSALAMGLLVTGTLAVGHWGGGSCRNNSLCYQDADGDGVCDNHGANCNYVDANGDGVCDNHGSNCNHVDANGDGICDNHGSNCNYVDANGDGVCDNQGQSCGQGLGNGQGHHGGGHHGGDCWN